NPLLTTSIYHLSLHDALPISKASTVVFATRPEDLWKQEHRGDSSSIGCHYAWWKVAGRPGSGAERRPGAEAGLAVPAGVEGFWRSGENTAGIQSLPNILYPIL